MRRYLVLTGLGLLAGLLLAAAVVFSRPYSFHGSVIQEPYPVYDFRLPSGPASEFRLADQRGSAVLLFFGFTNCQDVCPTTLASFKQIQQRLGKDAGRVKFVFITVDPARDTPQVASQYANGFDPAFAGLSGTEQQLDPVWKAYGVYRNIIHSENAPAGGDNHGSYDVEHSSQVYLIDPAGNLRLTYSYGTPVDDILQDVRQLLK